jgi:hypothetical protein
VHPHVRAMETAADHAYDGEVHVEVLRFPCGYEDRAGHEAILWRLEGSRRHKLPSLDFFITPAGSTRGAPTSMAWSLSIPPPSRASFPSTGPASCAT